MKPILLDTHVAIWALEGALDKITIANIDEAAAQSRLMLSPISAWEIGMIAAKGKVILPKPAPEYVRTLFSRRGAIVAALSPEIAFSATALPKSFHADPADRFLVATAIAYGADFYTRDREILRYARSAAGFNAVRV